MLFKSSFNNILKKEVKYMASKIILNNSSIKVYDYKPGDCEELEKSLSVWNSNYYRWEPKGMNYDEDNHILILPRGIDVE